MEGITIYSTVYPIEYITETLYGDYSDVYSIYPNEVIELTDKLIADYSNSNLFVYNFSPTFSDSDLLKMFSPFGTVISAKVRFDEDVEIR